MNAEVRTIDAISWQFQALLLLAVQRTAFLILITSTLLRPRMLERTQDVRMGQVVESDGSALEWNLRGDRCDLGIEAKSSRHVNKESLT
jgi:hypothetical protein